MVGGALITLLNNADRVRCACLARLVNVIGPIMTETGAAAWRQTIFHPFALTARYAAGRVLRAVVSSPGYATTSAPEIPYLLSSVVEDEASGRVAIFALNRHLSEELAMLVDLRGFDVRAVETALQVHHADMKATNTKDALDTLAPAPLEDVTITDGRVRARLRPGSWNMIALRTR